ncbi:MAG: molybdenum cofactor guanylyltransferase [Planctomycetota bacterium]|jgi:molybdopterin-guanine dinucleotide biosynthesis protein A
MTQQNITGIILAGGKSTRMGRDKGQVMYQKIHLIEYSIKLLESYCNDIIISTNEPAQYRKYGFRIVVDEFKNSGPMGGIHASLKKSVNYMNFILACDMPNVTQEVIDVLISHSSKDQITVPTLKGRGEPLCALYPRDTYLQLEHWLAVGRFKMQEFLQNAETSYVSMDNFTDAPENIFKNMNSPADLNY